MKSSLGILIGRYADRAKCSKGQIGTTPRSIPPERVGKRRLSASFKPIANHRAASDFEDSLGGGSLGACRRGVPERDLHQMDRCAPAEAMAGVCVPQPAGRHQPAGTVNLMECGRNDARDEAGDTD